MPECGCTIDGVSGSYTALCLKHAQLVRRDRNGIYWLSRHEQQGGYARQRQVSIEAMRAIMPDLTAKQEARARVQQVFNIPRKHRR